MIKNCVKRVRTCLDNGQKNGTENIKNVRKRRQKNEEEGVGAVVGWGGGGHNGGGSVV